MEEANKPTTHDTVFKKVFGKPAVAAEFFQSVLPAPLAEEIDWEGLELQRESFIDDEFQSSASDLLFSTTMGDEPTLCRAFWPS
jgi:predicted transposase YdaD